MRIPNHLSGSGLSFNMTPMIDVVFLLIIFFLVSSHLAHQEVHVDLDLPEAQTGQTDQPDSTRRLIVNLLPEPVEGKRISIGGSRLDLDELDALLRFERDRTDRPLEVRIRGDQTVPYGEVEPILLTCARAGVWQVGFAVMGR